MNFASVLTITWRELILYFRNRARVIGTLGVPFFYMLTLGFGLNPVLSVKGTSYFSFLVPGIIGLVILFQSVFSGLSVVTERQFGFLKEMLVAPIDRSDIVLGKTLGNSITATIQGVLVFLIAALLGFWPTTGILSILAVLPVMFLISVGFVGFGLVLAARVSDPQVFQVLFNFIIMPLFLLSGAMFPLDTAPSWLRTIVYLDPLGYGLDLLRGLLIGFSHLPVWQNLLVIIVFDVVMLVLASWLFQKSQ